LNRGLKLAMLSLAMLGCERLVGPARPARTAAPMVEVAARRFDTLEWPLAQRRVELPAQGPLEKLATILRFPKQGPPVTGIEIRDVATWSEFWSGVALEDTLRPPPPFVDFNQDIVYVVIAEQRSGEWPLARIEISRVLRSESRYSVFTTTWLAPRVDGAATRLVDAVVVPAIAEPITLFVNGPMPGRGAPTK